VRGLQRGAIAYVVKRKLKRGGYAPLVRYDADGKVRSRQFPRRVEAERFANSTEVAKSAGSWIDPARGTLTFADWVERWRPTQVNLRASTRARTDGYLDAHILPRFGPLALSKIEHADVRTWVAELSASGLAPATVAKGSRC
jgi:integrase-like protein